MNLCKVISPKTKISDNDENLHWEAMCGDGVKKYYLQTRLYTVHVNNVVPASSLFLCPLHRYVNEQNQGILCTVKLSSLICRRVYS
jgi:hypothetical protein